MNPTKVRQEFVQLFQGRTAVTLPAFHVVAELLQHLSGIRHCVGVNFIPPCRPGNRKYCTEMGQIVTGCLRLDASALFAHAPQRILDQLLTVDVLVVELA
ncbi:hypothetical protein D3C76_1654130 [compost metagenome]